MGTKRVFVTGKVQGVGFRAQAKDKAVSLGINGFVRNLDDGRVEILISGDGRLLEEYLAWIRVGPPTSRIENIEAYSENSTYNEAGFSILKDGIVK